MGHGHKPGRFGEQVMDPRQVHHLYMNMLFIGCSLNVINILQAAHLQWTDHLECCAVNYCGHSLHLQLECQYWICQGCRNPGHMVVLATRFYVVTLNICGSLVWNLLVSLVARTILKWCLRFWKICGTPVCII